MQRFPTIIGSLAVFAIFCTTAARAEHWVESASVPGLPQYNVPDSKMCVDMDSVKTRANGWTYYRDRACFKADGLITENMTLCSQDFTGETYHAQERFFHQPGPWRTLDKGTSAPVGVTARFVCHK